MTTLFSFLLSAVGPLATRLLLSLGVSVVSFSTVVLLFNSLIESAKNTFISLPAVTIQLASIGGAGECLGIITAAFLVRLSLVSLKRFQLSGA